MKRKSKKTKYIALSAIMASLVCAATMIRIPAPSIDGFVHAGDSMVFFAAAILPFPFGAAASCIGGGLADLFFGYVNWLPFTVVIKALNVIPFGVLRRFNKNKKFISVPFIIAMLISGIITCVMYTLGARIIYGTWAGAMADLPGNAIQSTASGIVYILLGTAFDASKIMKRFN